MCNSQWSEVQWRTIHEFSCTCETTPMKTQRHIVGLSLESLLVYTCTSTCILLMFVWSKISVWLVCYAHGFHVCMNSCKQHYTFNSTCVRACIMLHGEARSEVNLCMV